MKLTYGDDGGWTNQITEVDVNIKSCVNIVNAKKASISRNHFRYHRTHTYTLTENKYKSKNCIVLCEKIELFILNAN